MEIVKIYLSDAALKELRDLAEIYRENKPGNVLFQKPIAELSDEEIVLPFIFAGKSRIKQWGGMG